MFGIYSFYLYRMHTKIQLTLDLDYNLITEKKKAPF